MPWSTILYQKHRVEMRDSRLSDLFTLLVEVSNSFTSSQPNAGQLTWLREAVEDWKSECELPPGCKIIKLDKWLGQKERSETFSDFIAYTAEILRSRAHPDPALASEAEKVWKLLRELKGSEWLE
jgi:hypothetical protein